MTRYQALQQDQLLHACRRAAAGLSVLNAMAVILFSVLLFVVPVASALSSRLRFAELDRAGIINAHVLSTFSSSYGFGDTARLEYRHTVADYIAEPAASAQRLNAMWGLLFTLVNAIVWSAIWWRLQPARIAVAEPTSPEDAACGLKT